jgi:hypothetical protein
LSLCRFLGKLCNSRSGPQGLGVIVLTSQEKWDCMKNICKHWRDLLLHGKTELNFKQLRLDQGFMVYVTQAYPGLKTYLKGCHLSLEMWRDGRDREGWKLQGKVERESDSEEMNTVETSNMENIKIQFLTHDDCEGGSLQDGPTLGVTPAAPHFLQDLEAILHLTEGEQPQVRSVRSKCTITAYYGFCDALFGGFGATVERPGGLHRRFGLWGKDDEEQSSNYRELCNLVDTVEEKAKEGHLKNGELWLFTNNSTAKSCFF